ncbi:MAG TPA: pilus assembly protein N-terminal domain-containing protein [Planctomycetaceae bacterium]|nr:pilus assembly protein N-terminal domain-containing protein [Planctomycetaceae bacterium]
MTASKRAGFAKSNRSEVSVRYQLRQSQGQTTPLVLSVRPALCAVILGAAGAGICATLLAGSAAIAQDAWTPITGSGAAEAVPATVPTSTSAFQPQPVLPARPQSGPFAIASQLDATQPSRTAPQPGPVVPGPPIPGAADETATSQPSPFEPSQVRLPLLGSAGTTPHPSDATLERFKEFVAGTIDPDNTLDLVVGRPRVLVLKQAPIRTYVAEPRTVSYTIITPTELSVVGHQVGSTVLTLWFADSTTGQTRVLSYLVRVIPDPEQKERLDRVYKALEVEINKAFPNSVVHLALLGDKLVVSGEAKDIVDAANILRVVSANAPGGSRSQERERSASEIPVGQINVTAVPDASGNLPQQGLENFLLRDVNRNVVNLLRVPGEQQVMLRVTVAEISRTAARSIGLDFTVLNAAGTAVFSSTTGGLIPTTVTGMGTTTQLIGGNLPAIIDNGKVTLAIQALRNINLARSLAEQNVVALNGQTARFRAGGEFPVPAATVTFGAVAQGVSFIPFGVQMQFVPFITDRDRVRLQVGATVSTLDPSLGTNIGGSAGAGGTTVPGLNSRTFQTTVELRGGQTFAVAGLTQNTFGATTARVPFFGDLPIVGSLAGENQTSHGEQEIVILVTPELVHPLQTCTTPPLPGADVFEPGDVEFYLLNRLESRRSYDYRSSVRTDCARQKRYEHCDDLFIIGAHGQTYNCCPQGGACSPVAGAQPMPIPDAVPMMPAGRAELPPTPSASTPNLPQAVMPPQGWNGQ